VDQFITKESIIYEIKVNISQPILFLFDNTEQLECLLPPGTHLKIIDHSRKLYKKEEILIIRLKLI